MGGFELIALSKSLQMKEILYIEIPVPETSAVLTWLHQYDPGIGQKTLTPTGFRVSFPHPSSDDTWVVFLWSLQRTTYLKVFRWGDRPLPEEGKFLKELQESIQAQFPFSPSSLPLVDLNRDSIFTALERDYPQTVRFFQKIPNGETDLNRVYWWERRWREGIGNPQHPQTVVSSYPQTVAPTAEESPSPLYDIIYVGGALGIIHATVMAQRGYRVLLVERLTFGRMNREWNISRTEFQSLIDLGVFTPEEFAQIIARETKDGFHKFFDANNPPIAKAPVLHTPEVLNITIDAEPLLQRCGEKFRAAGGDVWDETEFKTVTIYADRAILEATHLTTGTQRQAHGRLVVDAMGTASPIAWQLTQGRPFDSVCPTVGAVIADGFEPEVWDSHYGDVLHSHGDISRGRQLIWELFPGRGREVTIYLFHYHQPTPENPGSLLEMYEDFFTILPEYRRCNLDQLAWKKATFGYIPGYFSVSGGDRPVALDRLVAIGDAASLQSPLIFTGFGSLVRNLPRLTGLLDLALRHDLLDGRSLNYVRAYQNNVAVTWLFSKGMMVPMGKTLPPTRINAMLNTFFDILASESPRDVDAFMKDRSTWGMFNRMALKAARKNPALLLWIWELAGARDLWRWLGNYVSFSRFTLWRFLVEGWLPKTAERFKPWLETRYPALWLWLLAQRYAFMVERPLSGSSNPAKTN